MAAAFFKNNLQFRGTLVLISVSQLMFPADGLSDKTLSADLSFYLSSMFLFSSF